MENKEMQQDEKIDAIQQLLKSEEYRQNLREFQNMIANLDNN